MNYQIKINIYKMNKSNKKKIINIYKKHINLNFKEMQI